MKSHPAPALIETHALVKEYHGRRVVDGIHIRLCAGEIVGLLGPNGAGKTTTFYMIAGLIRPDSGCIEFNGVDVTRVPMYQRARRGLGYLPQEPSVFRKLTVEENILVVLETLGIPHSERRERLTALVRELGLESVARQKAYTLSGGERRKLEITRALAMRPLVLLLDEPFSGVDPLAVEDIQRILLALKQKGLGILLTDHNVRETLSVVDRAYLIYGGRVLREGESHFLIHDELSRQLYLGESFRL